MVGQQVRTITAVLCLALSIVIPSAMAEGLGGLLQQGQKLLSPSSPDSQTGGTLSRGDIGAGLKEALRVGSDRVVSRLGATDGFNLDPAVHIPLPEKFATVKKMMAGIGMGGMVDDLELRLNRAAETATPKAKELFIQSIEKMTLDDVQKIYQGSDDAATRYFEEAMSPALAEEMRPVVDQSLSEVGAIQAYETVMGEYRSMPLVPDIKTDLTSHVVDAGMKGIFHYLAVEEAAIRKDPAKRTTELLQKVFSGE